MGKPLVSVIVPLFNYSNYIGYCIQSIMNQTFADFELIVVDDCSTDDSYKKAKKYAKKDDRIKVVRLDNNSGYSKAKNEGIVISKGKYITTLDADDMFTKNSIEVRLKALTDNDVDFVYANAFFVKNDVSLKDCYRHGNHKINSSVDLYNIHAQSVMMNRDVYVKYGLYDESLRSRSDREMWWRLFGKDISQKPKITHYYLNEQVAYYRFHRESMWRKRKRNPKVDKKVIKMSEKAYKMRKNDGITIDNTRFLDAS